MENSDKKPRKIKATALTRQKKERIGKYKEKYPTANYYEIAQKFKCTYDQASKACKDYRNGYLFREKTETKPADIQTVIDTMTADELLEKQYHTAVAQLEVEKNISIESRVRLLDSLFSMRKILQQLKLESFIKRADAGIIKNIIKRFKPDATDDEVIKIYLEEYERWKIEK